MSRLNLAEGLGVVVVLTWLAVLLFLAGSWVTGIVVAFSAAWWIGIVCFIFPPLALVNGIAYLVTWGSVDLASKVLFWITGPAASLVPGLFS